MKVIGIVVLAIIWFLFGCFIVGFLFDDVNSYHKDTLDPHKVLFAVFWPVVVTINIIFIFYKVPNTFMSIGASVRKLIRRKET